MNPFELGECRSKQPNPKTPQRLFRYVQFGLSVQVAFDYLALYKQQKKINYLFLNVNQSTKTGKYDGTG